MFGKPRSESSSSAAVPIAMPPRTPIEGRPDSIEAFQMEEAMRQSGGSDPNLDADRRYAIEVEQEDIRTAMTRKEYPTRPPPKQAKAPTTKEPQEPKAKGVRRHMSCES